MRTTLLEIDWWLGAGKREEVFELTPLQRQSARKACTELSYRVHVVIYMDMMKFLWRKINLFGCAVDCGPSSLKYSGLLDISQYWRPYRSCKHCLMTLQI